MQTYLVGGAVRDQLLGLPVKDRDWVVVGATPQQMLDAGFKPVGRDFPVFIHPDTGEEYALARTERKSGKGYTGFTFHASPDVTLEADLQRRDLTINAIAQHPDGTLIDPYHGRDDLDARILRHVSPAFSEDPLRVLRVARFAARYAHLGFRIADETLALMRTLSEGDELQHLTPERVWQEFDGALASASPITFIDVLTQVGALETLLPEFSALDLTTARQTFQHLIDTGATAEQRFSLLMALATRDQDIQPAQHQIEQICQRLRIPNRYRDLALQLRTWHSALLGFDSLDANTRLRLIRHLDLPRRPERLESLRPCVEALYAPEHPFATQLAPILDAIAGIQPRELMAEGFSGKALGEELERRQLALCQMQY